MRLKFAGEHQHDSEVSGLECEWSGKAQVKLFSISLTSHDWWMEKKKNTTQRMIQRTPSLVKHGDGNIVGAFSGKGIGQIRCIGGPKN